MPASICGRGVTRPDKGILRFAQNEKLTAFKTPTTPTSDTITTHTEQNRCPRDYLSKHRLTQATLLSIAFYSGQERN